MEAVRAYNWIELARTGLGLGVVLGLFALQMLNVTLRRLRVSIPRGCVCALIGAVRGRPSGVVLAIRPGDVPGAFGYGVIFFANNLLAFLLLKSDFFLVNHFLGLDEVGIYSVSVQVADLLLLAPATLGTLLFPRLSAIQDATERTQTCLQFARLTSAGMAAACLAVGLISPVAIPLVLGAAFRPAWRPWPCCCRDLALGGGECLGHAPCGTAPPAPDSGFLAVRT